MARHLRAIVLVVVSALALAACGASGAGPSSAQRKAVAGIIGSGSAGHAPGSGHRAAANSRSTSSTSSSPITAAGSPTTAASTTSSTTQAAPPAGTGSALTQFGDGTWAVGSTAHTVAPGTYFTKGAGGDCRWDRTGSDGSLLGTEVVTGPAVAMIAPGDATFISSGCGRWRLEKHGPEVRRFSDGDYAVGVTIAPGTYVSTGGPGCSWREAGDFSGSTSAVIHQQSEAMGVVTVDLEPPVAEFHTTGCGTWLLTG